MLQILLEQWTSCNGQWAQSEFFLQIKQKRRNRTIGSRRWMCKAELLSKFGSQDVVNQLIQAKTLDAEIAATHVRANPDLHGMDTDDPR